MQRRPGTPVDSTRMFENYICWRSSQQFHLALAGLALAAVDSAHYLAVSAHYLAVSALDLAVSALDLAVSALDLAVSALDLAVSALDLAGFVLELDHVGFEVPLVDLAVADAGFVPLLADLAPARGPRVFALLLPVHCLARIATVSRPQRLYQQAKLLDLSLCRVVQSNRILRGRCVRQVPHAIDGFLSTPSRASFFGWLDRSSYICRSYNATDQPRLASLQRDTKSSVSMSETYHRLGTLLIGEYASWRRMSRKQFNTYLQLSHTKGVTSGFYTVDKGFRKLLAKSPAQTDTPIGGEWGYRGTVLKRLRFKYRKVSFVSFRDIISIVIVLV